MKKLCSPFSNNKHPRKIFMTLNIAKDEVTPFILPLDQVQCIDKFTKSGGRVLTHLAERMYVMGAGHPKTLALFSRFELISRMIDEKKLISIIYAKARDELVVEFPEINTQYVISVNPLFKLV